MRFLSLLLLIALSLSACGRGKETTGADSLLQSIKQDLRDGRLKKARILFLEYYMETVARLNPEDLERYAESPNGAKKLIDVDARIQNGLLEALDKTTLSEAEDPPDVRWGAIFYDAGASALHSIYIDGKYINRTGNHAFIDGKLVGVNGALRAWFEHTFEDLMKAAREGE